MNSSTRRRQLPRKLCCVIICSNTSWSLLGKEWGGRASEICCSSVKGHRRTGPTFKRWDFIDGGNCSNILVCLGESPGKSERSFVGISPTPYWSYHAALVAVLLWLLARWYRWSPSEMCKIKDLRELQVLWFPIIQSWWAESSDLENSLAFKNSIIERKGNSRAGKQSPMFIRVLRAAVISAGFWKKLIPLPAKSLGVWPGWMLLGRTHLRTVSMHKFWAQHWAHEASSQHKRKYFACFQHVLWDTLEIWVITQCLGQFSKSVKLLALQISQRLRGKYLSFFLRDSRAAHSLISLVLDRPCRSQ